MNIPIIDNVLGIISGGAEWLNKRDKRRRQAVIRSAKRVVEQLRDIEIPERARHYVDQMEVRLGRLT